MNIKTDIKNHVAIIHLNRPNSLNALNSELMDELISTMQLLDRKPDIGCFIITGTDRTFAAGADIKEMANRSFMNMFIDDFFSGWDAFTAIRTPKIAAVSGFAYGGGCELAMMCDMIFASESATFAQPEIKLGVIPGMGGSQRLTKLVGKSLAMDMILTGRIIDAKEAKSSGLVSRIIPNNELMDKSIEAAITISNHSKASTIAAREVIDRALELSLREGILFERRCFHALFCTDDQKEGMKAFIEKREPNFTNQ